MRAERIATSRGSGRVRRLNFGPELKLSMAVASARWVDVEPKIGHMIGQLSCYIQKMHAISKY